MASNTERNRPAICAVQLPNHRGLAPERSPGQQSEYFTALKLIDRPESAIPQRCHPFAEFTLSEANGLKGKL
jgi:hypothetical protein